MSATPSPYCAHISRYYYQEIFSSILLSYHNNQQYEEQAGAELGQAQLKLEVVDEVLAEVKLKFQL